MNQNRVGKIVQGQKQSHDSARITSEVLISKDTEFDDEIKKETRKFLEELEKSKDSNLIIVGWKPD